MNTVNDDELGLDYEAFYLNEESEQDTHQAVQAGDAD